MTETCIMSTHQLLDVLNAPAITVDVQGLVNDILKRRLTAILEDMSEVDNK